MSIPHNTDGVTASLRYAMSDIARRMKAVFCHPDDAQRVRDAVDRLEAPGLFRVQPSAVVDPGHVVIVDLSMWPERA